MKESLHRISRRRVLILAGIGVTAAAAATLLLGPLREQWPEAGNGKRNVSQKARSELFATITAFMGTLFGRQLTLDDQNELLDRLEFTVAHDPKRWQDYVDLKRYLDNAARELGAQEFALATLATQAEILDRLMSIRFNSWQSHLVSQFATRAARFRRIGAVTVPALAWLYANSGVPWRARGYTRWPGIPGDWREVLSPGKSVS